jgi:hypothetical protein
VCIGLCWYLNQEPYYLALLQTNMVEIKPNDTKWYYQSKIIDKLIMYYQDDEPARTRINDSLLMTPKDNVLIMW